MKKESKNKLTFLGTGASMGIPVIGCTCSVCKSDFKKNKRLRPSVFVEMEEKKILIDTTPDFRLQALSYSISHIDAVLITHIHYDHTGGLDDLRIFCIRQKKAIPLFTSPSCGKDLKNRFPYMFLDQNHPNNPIFLPNFSLKELEKERGFFKIDSLKIQYFSYEQTGLPVLGFRFGDLAYVSDIRNYPETIFEDLKGVKILILSCLQFNPSPLHFSIDEAIQFSNQVGAKKTFLTHISHDLDHDKINLQLPSNVQLSYDGLEIDF